MATRSSAALADHARPIQRSHMTLLAFPHSHYCEKARWALDHKSRPYRYRVLLPGFHVITVRRHAPDASLPVLLVGGDVVQGSSAIIDYLDRAFPAHALTPDVPDARQVCLALERDMDARLGETLRQILYDALLAYPDYLEHAFTHAMPVWKRLLFRLSYPALRKRIHATYVRSNEAVAQARAVFDDAMTELRHRLDGRRYLVGEQFSRADLSVASMLSLLVMPAEHPFPWRAVPDPRIRRFLDAYRAHPVALWAADIYRLHRLPERVNAPRMHA